MAVTAAIGAFVAAWRAFRAQSGRPTELFAGAAGFLVAAPALVNSRLAAELVDTLSTVAREAAHDVLHKVRMTRLAAKETDKESDIALGFAHGLAGELWALANAGYTDEAAREWQALDARSERDARYVLWPAHAGAPIADDRRATLCHGVTGHALTCEALAASGHRTARERWKSAANTAFRLSSPAIGLCCGVAGQALVLYRYARTHKDALYARRARRRLQQAIAIARPVLRVSPPRLWRGPLGVALVALRMLARETHLPALEPRAMSLAYVRFMSVSALTD